MNIRAPRRTASTAAFTLLEVVMYAALLVIVLGCAMAAFYQCWDDSKSLHRNADAIVRVLHAGDEWRNDVRAAAGPVTQTEADRAKQLRIPSGSGVILYTFSDGELHRQAGTNASRLLLSNIKSSEMQPDPRRNVAAWRWELELKTAKRTTLFRPLFTFETVERGAATQ